MNGAHLHLLLIHFPIAGMVLAIPLLLAAWWKRSEILKITGLVLVLLAGAASAGAYLTGEEAEEVVEHLPGISESIIHEHEEAAEKAIWVVGTTSLLAAFGLFGAWKRKTVSPWVFKAVVFLTLACAAALAQVSNLGGHVSHPEIQPGFITPAENHKD